MYTSLFSEELKEKLKKLKKREKVRLEAVNKKISEIEKQPEHYKPLKHDMRNLRRVHIDKSFVLVYKIENNVIKFLDIDHHDKIYRKRYDGK